MTTDVATQSLTLAQVLPKSVFADIQLEAFKFRFAGEIQLVQILGGVPSDPKVIEGWLKAKVGIDKEAQITAAVEQIMEQRGIDRNAAAEELAKNKMLNGFYRLRCPDCATAPVMCDKEGVHQLHIEGRHLKAGIKEAAMVAVGAGRLGARGWGKTNKGMLGWIAEHVMVVEDRLPLFKPDGSIVTEPDRVHQHFVNGRYGSAISYQEVVDNAVVKFTVISDHDFSPKEWGHIWAGGELQGLGSSRSQSYGRYAVTKWEQLT